MPIEMDTPMAIFYWVLWEHTSVMETISIITLEVILFQKAAIMEQVLVGLERKQILAACQKDAVVQVIRDTIPLEIMVTDMPMMVKHMGHSLDSQFVFE